MSELEVEWLLFRGFAGRGIVNWAWVVETTEAAVVGLVELVASTVELTALSI